MLDFTKYENTLPYAAPLEDPQAFDAWANRNDILQERFSDDMNNYMVDVLSETDDLEVDSVIMKKLQTIVDIIINEKDSFEDRFWFALELLPLV